MKKNKSKIMERIEKNKVRMKPKWYFQAQWLGLNLITWGLLLGCSGLAAWMVFEIELMEVGEILQYGRLGKEIVAEDFPYGVLISSLATGIGGYFLLRNLGQNYKKSGKIMLLTTGVIVTMAVIGWWLLKSIYELEIMTSLL